MKKTRWSSTIIIASTALCVFNPSWLGLKLYLLHQRMPLLSDFTADFRVLIYLMNTGLLLVALYASKLLIQRKQHAFAVLKVFSMLMLVLFACEAALFGNGPVPVQQLQLITVLLLVNFVFQIFTTFSSHGKELSKTDYFALIRSFSQLFNKKLYGVNFYLLFAFAVAAFSYWAFMEFLINNQEPNYLAFAVILLFALIKGVFFLLLVHYSAKNWYLPLVWGLVNGAVEQSRYYLESGKLNLLQATEAFLTGFIFMLALVLTVRYYGTKFFTIMLAGAISYPVAVWMNTQAFYYYTHRTIFMEPNVAELMQSAAEGLMLGGFLYLSTYVYFQRWSALQR